MSKVLDDLFAPLDDVRFKRGAFRASIALSLASLLDMATSLVMMRVKNPSYEANIAFREFYLHPSSSNLVRLLGGQLVFIVPIVLGFLLSKIKIKIPRSLAAAKQGGFILRAVLMTLAGMRVYGMSTNMLALLYDQTSVLLHACARGD